MKKLLMVTATEMTDIRENVLKYLVIGEGDKKVIINVGDKTFRSVVELIQSTARPLPKEEEKK